MNESEQKFDDPFKDFTTVKLPGITVSWSPRLKVPVPFFESWPAYTIGGLAREDSPISDEMKKHKPLYRSCFALRLFSHRLCVTIW